MEPLRFDPYCEDCVYLREKPEACSGCQYWLEQELDKLVHTLDEIANYDYGLKGGYYGAYLAMKELAMKTLQEVAW